MAWVRHIYKTFIGQWHEWRGFSKEHMQAVYREYRGKISYMDSLYGYEIVEELPEGAET